MAKAKPKTRARTAPRKRPAPRARPVSRPPAPDDIPLLPPPPKPQRTTFELGIDPKRIDESIQQLRKQIGHWTRRGFADKVRISYKGKAIAPDIPVAYFLAAEALTFWFTGFLSALLVNVGAKAFLTVELISSAEEHYNRGMERYLAGDVDSAGAAFEKGVESDPYHAGCHLMLGVAMKVKGSWTGARKHFERAAELDPNGALGAKAREHLRQMSRRADEPIVDDGE